MANMREVRVSGESGFTLPEMAVSSFLLSIVMLLTLSAIEPSMRVSRQAEESIGAQREVVMAFDRVLAEISLMDRASVSAVDGCLSYLSHSRMGGGTNPSLSDSQLDVLSFAALNTTWQKFVVFRLRDSNLYRQEYPYNGGSTLARIKPNRLLELADEPGRAEKIFAKGVEEFQVGLVGASRLSFRVRSVQRGSRNPEACDVNFQICMRGTN